MPCLVPYVRSSHCSHVGIVCSVFVRLLSKHLTGKIDEVSETSDMLSYCEQGVETRSCRIGSGSAARYMETFAKYENRQTCRLQ